MDDLNLIANKFITINMDPQLPAKDMSNLSYIITTFSFKYISVILLILTILIAILKRYKDKKEESTKLTNKKMKVLYIITGITLIISFVLENIYIW